MEAYEAAEKGKPSVHDLPTAAGALGHGASILYPPASPRNPPPIDFAMEAKIGGISSLEDSDDYLAREEEKLEQEKRQFVGNLEQRKLQFEEKCRADCAELSEDLEWRRRIVQHIERVQGRESELEEERAWLAREQSEFEKKMEYDRIILAQRKAEIQRKMEEIQREEREYLNKVREDQLEYEKQMEDDWNRLDQKEAELQRRSDELERQEREFLAMHKEQLQKPDCCKKKNSNAWDLGPIIYVLVVPSGLAFLVQMCSLLPLVYLQYIVDAFAVFWALGSVLLSFRIIERFRGHKTLRHYAARHAFLCFTLVGMYALYLISRHLDDTSSRASPPSATAQ